MAGSSAHVANPSSDDRPADRNVMPARPHRRTPTWRRRARELALVVPALTAFVLLRWADLVSDTPVWIYAVALFGTYLLSNAASAIWPDDAPQPRLWLRTGVVVLAATVPMYLTGWGPMLV